MVGLLLLNVEERNPTATLRRTPMTMQQQQQSYPIMQLSATSTQEDLQKAVQATIQQLISEGSSPDDAAQSAQQMLAQVQQSLASAAIPRKTSQDMSQATMNMNSRFARGAGGQGVGSDGSNGYNSVPNPWFTNFNPTTVGSYSNK